jgi:hypothetical protein
VSVADTLTKQVGPLPLGVWLLVGGGGLAMAYRTSKQREPRLVTDVREVPVPVGAIASPDQAPVVITPIFRLPEIINNVSVPAAEAPDVTIDLPAPPVPVSPPPPNPTTKPPAPPRAKPPAVVLRPSGDIVTTNVNPHPYPTAPAPNGARAVKDGSGREWVTVGSIPGVTGYVWNRNTGRWTRR